jgi:hypothetical protein
LSTLPDDIRKNFPIVLEQRSGFTKRLYEYLISGLYQGPNFMELAEGIASMNYREFWRNNQAKVDLANNFETNIFCSYPSNDKLVPIAIRIYKGTLRK